MFKVLNLRKVLLSLFLIGFSFACSSAQSGQGRESCRQAAELLKTRIGPELSRINALLPLPISSSSKYGCVMTFSRVLEELPGEVLGEYISSGSSQEVAFGMPDVEGRIILSIPEVTLLDAPSESLRVSVKEVYGGGLPEIIIESSSKTDLDMDRALRIFMYAEGVPRPKEVFSSVLMIPVGPSRKIPARWQAKVFEGNAAIFLTSGKKTRIHIWSESLQRFQYDLSASQRYLQSSTAGAVKLSKRKPSSAPSSLVPLVEEKKSQESSSQSSSAPKEPVRAKDPPARLERKTSSKPKDAFVFEDPTGGSQGDDLTTEETPYREQRSEEESSPSQDTEKKTTTVDEFLEGI